MASLREGAAATAGGSGTGGGASGGAARPHRSSAPPWRRAGAARDLRFDLTGEWAQPLRKCALDPANADQTILYIDEQVVLILKDRFPKALYHALAVARDPALRSIADLRPEHLPLLAHMREVAVAWVRQEKAKDPGAVAFKLGFHAVPSMAQLHMHVASQDFDSPTLKKKKHWNAFTTAFFLPLETVEAELRDRGRLALMPPAEERRLEGLGLRCHGCGQPYGALPELKQHIVGCEGVRRLPGL
ncbi:hypothetical protein HYH03_015605 [Edaphochlamys debaryana]|uniref:Aprataxin C2HE/C2H2/C2HC zinc finger domain-containing protein n=1 Tax=Edaphochlamys debaryana TaxID=47281 RepID=A0A835XP32_9CHLO|nr:hypothetical protein HYH03_015605 [Edaphochlamys debaryana]|eukprot:KAG2485721.1 hypothetical protein HYH03_015605 [Edaphochlamys debaryana]